MRPVSRRALLATGTALLPGCAAQRGVTRLVLGHDNPTDHPVEAGVREAIRHLAAATSGAIELQSFPAIQLGTQQEQVLSCIMGSQHLYVSGYLWLAQYYRPFGVLESPYVFLDPEQMYRGIESPLGRDLQEGLLHKTGLRVLDTWYYGRRHLTLVGRDVRTPAELKGMKIRAPNAPIYIETIRALGANPAPMGIGEVYLALKTGAIDGQENPLPTIEAFKFHEVARHLILTGHLLTPVAVIMGERRWQKLDDSARKAVVDAFRAGREVNNRLILEQEARLLDKFRQDGLSIVEPDLDAFRASASAVARRFEAEWGSGTYERLVEAAK